MARAVTSERERVATIAGACKGRNESVLRAAIEAIHDGRDAVSALTAMLDAQAYVPPPAMQTWTSVTTNVPNMQQIRLATSHVQPLGSAPLPEAPATPSKARPHAQARREWESLSEAQRSEFNNNFIKWATATGGTTLGSN